MRKKITITISDRTQTQIKELQKIYDDDISHTIERCIDNHYRIALKQEKQFIKSESVLTEMYDDITQQQDNNEIKKIVMDLKDLGYEFDENNNPLNKESETMLKKLIDRSIKNE